MWIKNLIKLHSLIDSTDITLLGLASHLVNSINSLIPEPFFLRQSESAFYFFLCAAPKGPELKDQKPNLLVLLLVNRGRKISAV